MKKLLLTLVLGLSFALPLSSYAGVNAFGVQLPVGKKEVNSNIGHGYVAKDFGDTLNVQKLERKDNTISTEDDSDKYLVFGVDINSINKI
ncbi:MAG: hypothetical protein ACR2NC_01645 [Thermodesulfobacteriota bacterium]